MEPANLREATKPLSYCYLWHWQCMCILIFDLNVESKLTNNALQRTLLKASDLPGQWCASIRSVTKNTFHARTMKTKKQAQLEANKQVNGQKKPRLWTPTNLKLTN